MIQVSYVLRHGITWLKFMPKGCLRSLDYLLGLLLGNHIPEPKLNGAFILPHSCNVVFIFWKCLITNVYLK